MRGLGAVQQRGQETGKRAKELHQLFDRQSLSDAWMDAMVSTRSRTPPRKRSTPYMLAWAKGTSPRASAGNRCRCLVITGENDGALTPERDARDFPAVVSEASKLEVMANAGTTR